MGSVGICGKTQYKKTNNTNREYDILNSNINKYLRKDISKKIDSKENHTLKSNHDSILNKTDYNNHDSSNFKNNIPINNVVFQSRSNNMIDDQECNYEKFFGIYLKTGEIKRSNLCRKLDNKILTNISLEIISLHQQENINSKINVNLFEAVTFRKIQSYHRIKDLNPFIETTQISEKLNFKSINNKNIHDLMNNIYFPGEFQHIHIAPRNTMNFSLNSVSFRELHVPLTQLSISTSNINNNIYNNNNNIYQSDVSNYKKNFYTQPNEDIILKRRPSNFTNFNKKVKNIYLDSEKNTNLSDSSSNIAKSVKLKNKNSIISKSLRRLYDSIFIKNSMIGEMKTNSNNINSATFGNINFERNLKGSLSKSYSSSHRILKTNKLFSRNHVIPIYKNLPKTNLYTIEDYNIDEEYPSKLYKKLTTIENLNKIKSIRYTEIKNRNNIRPTEKLARKLFYSHEVRSKILERKEKVRELMERSLSDLEEEYKNLQEECNPIFNIKNAIEEESHIHEVSPNDSSSNLYPDKKLIKNKKIEKKKKYNLNNIFNKARKKKSHLYEIDIKQLIKDSINEKILTESNSDKTKSEDKEKLKLIKLKNLNINNININIQTQSNTQTPTQANLNSESNYSRLNRKRPNIYSNESLKDKNIFGNSSSEFIKSIENYTNIKNCQYFDKKNQ